MAWEVLWLIGTTVTQRYHPTAERALGGGAQPDASISPQLACSLAADDAAKQRDAEGDRQVAKMMHGLSKRESRDFSPGGISLFLYGSQEHSTVRFKESAPAGTRSQILYFISAVQFPGNGKGFTTQPSRPRLPMAKLQLFPWQAVSCGTGGVRPAGRSSQPFPCADSPSDPATLGGALGGHPTTSPVPTRWVSHQRVQPWLDPKLLAAGRWSLRKEGR